MILQWCPLNHTQQHTKHVTGRIKSYFYIWETQTTDTRSSSGYPEGENHQTTNHRLECNTSKTQHPAALLSNSLPHYHNCKINKPFLNNLHNPRIQWHEFPSHCIHCLEFPQQMMKSEYNDDSRLTKSGAGMNNMKQHLWKLIIESVMMCFEYWNYDAGTAMNRCFIRWLCMYESVVALSPSTMKCQLAFAALPLMTIYYRLLRSTGWPNN